MEKFEGFGNIVLGLIVCAAIVQIVYYFISKRDPVISRIEKSLWHFVLGTAFYIILVFVSYLHLSTIGTRTFVPLVDERIEVVVQQLVKNQRQIKMEQDAIKDVVSFLLLMTGIYVMAALGILQQLRNERKKSQQAITARPLGLELD